MCVNDVNLFSLLYCILMEIVMDASSPSYSIVFIRENWRLMSSLSTLYSSNFLVTNMNEFVLHYINED
jgi:hypothetical protein